MNNREKKMEEMLIKLFKISHSLGGKINKDTVYNELTKGPVSKLERKFKISDLFPVFINYFKNKSNIQVFNSNNWKYFCQFENHNVNANRKLFNPIKMYLSVGSKNIYKVAIVLFDFLEQNNIYHDSKIASEVRCDDIVIRVYSKEDELKIRNFINNNKIIKKSLNDPNPFCFEQMGIGYAIDGNLSYNSTIANYISKYINDRNIRGKKVSLSDLYNYISDIYNQVFVNKTLINEYIKEYIDQRDIKSYGLGVVLNNYQEVTKLFLIAMREKDLSWFNGLLDDANNQDLVEKNIKSLSRETNSSQLNLEKGMVYLNKAILETFKKYDIEQVKYALINAYSFGDFNSFTNENKARSNLISNISLEDLREIIDSFGGIDLYILSVIPKDYQNLNSKIDYLNKAMLETFKKYDIEQVKYALKEAYNKGDFSGFTNEKNTRDDLIANLVQQDIKNIINIYGNSNIIEYINEVLKIKIDDNLTQGFKK